MTRTQLAWLAGLVATVALHFWSLDGVFGNAFLLLFGDDSAYSAGYSDARFRSIEVGDPEAAVEEALGDPIYVLSTNDPGGRVLYFSESPRSTHYRIRVIVIRDGIVARKRAQAWVD